MSTPTTPPPENTPSAPDGCWIIPYLHLKLADGSILIKPQKPILRASAKVTAKLTHVSPRTLARLAESGFIRCCFSTPDLRLYYPAEVEAFLEKTTSDPDFWTPARRAQYGWAREKKKKNADMEAPPRKTPNQEEG
jgi:hypothetical protein